MALPSNQLCKNLQTLWHQDFPVSRAMNVAVVSFTDHTLTTLTPLQGNTNTHGTAFAGSLYALQALTAWGALWLELEQLNLNASIIHAEGDIKFHKPLTTNITVTSTVDDPAAFAETLQAKGKVTLSMNASAGDGDHLASNFSGVYSVRLS